ncbi:NCS1 family nucleobase:cation symporter-1 [Clostridium sp. ZBS20]|uniref:NCS1 family nucleobase:cation symporter-1 n=1 Tax=Clostridium sp. ZBS20 TaxID=2949966 RepID=UPI00207AA486|nr:NCS1 family nucleobase:cation symporter-1 [Clostridium sp. ZBS20]
MNRFQSNNGEIVNLTSIGIAEIGKYKTVYTNDTRPINIEDRDWSAWNIMTLWIGIMVSIPVYMLASGLIASGMNWWQALITIVLGHTIVIVPATLLGHAGTKYGISYPLLSKLVFGPNGNVFPTMVRALLGCFWFGIQCWIGGTAINSLIGAIISSWNNWTPHLFICYFIFLILNLYIGATGSKAVKFMEDYSAPILVLMGIAVIVWAYKISGGFNLLLTHNVAQGNGGSFLKSFFPALTAMIAFDGTIALNISDFTRHAKSQKAQITGQFIGAPIMTAFIVFVGICGTVASAIAFGEPIWNPADLVSKFNNPVIVVMFSIFIMLATLTTNVAANLVAPGIIFSNLFSKKITYKKAIMIIGVIAVLVQPWRILNDPNNYIFEVNGILATFLGPMAGIYLASYWLEHKSKIELVDLYRTDGGEYYYNKGWNYKAIIILFTITVFLLLGRFIKPLKIFYDNSYVLGMIISIIIYTVYLVKAKKYN